MQITKLHCQLCKEVLSGSSYRRKGLIMCQNCFKKLQQQEKKGSRLFPAISFM